ncbi:hypothetical protein AX14_011443 [Amanita brunnescens Koide BX004]|nr:hypothetical protein AX14_011443 [Amanita brunnescens Koide BX004]
MSWFNLWKAPEQNDSPPATNETAKPNEATQLNETTKQNEAKKPDAFVGLRIGAMRGGVGGKGGQGQERGGKGGQGGGNRIKANGRYNVEIGDVEAGTGGEGGAGNLGGDAGDAGTNEVGNEEEPLLSQTRLPGPNMNIEEFGAKYHLSDRTVAQLSDCGYDTAGSVRFATAADLKADGFKQGQINQLKHALDIWSPKT